MDFSLVRNKLRQKLYTSTTECIDDVNRVFCNCYLFNQPGEDVIFMALKLDHFFREKIKHMFPETNYAVSINSRVSTPMSIQSNHIPLPVPKKHYSSIESSMNSILGKRKLDDEHDKSSSKLSRMDSDKSLREEQPFLNNDMAKCLVIIKELMSSKYRVSLFLYIYNTIQLYNYYNLKILIKARFVNRFKKFIKY